MASISYIAVHSGAEHRMASTQYKYGPHVSCMLRSASAAVTVLR